MTTRDYMNATPLPGTRIAYGTAPEQFGDLRLPDGPGPHPVAVVVHGGWWKSRFDLTYAGHLAAALTADGFATWNIEYRRIGSPDGHYPATLVDVSSALEKLRDLAPLHDLDLDRIVVTGHSAGAHIAAWLAAKPTRPELGVFGPSPRIAGAVAVAGPLDLEQTSALRVADMTGAIPVHDFLGGTPAEVPERYALTSPIRLLPAGVPVVAIHGTEDAAVPLELSERYVERALALGDPAAITVLPGVDHFEPFDPASAAGAIVRAAIRELAGLQRT